MADVTLTASMRANLYSLQQTAQMMGTVQQRLATGKKVNSALDNPNNYFTAQSLSNRASDISNLLDGMGQAIQTIKAATQGIESAQKLIDQMKSVANSALQTASSSASGARTVQMSTGTTDTAKLLTEDDNSMLLTNLKNNSTGLLLTGGGGSGGGIIVGDTLSMGVAGGTTATYTVTETSSVQDMVNWMESQQSQGATTVAVTSGVMQVTNNAAATLTIAGNVATALGINAAGLTAAATTTNTTAVASGPAMLATLATGGTANDSIALTTLTDSNGASLGIALGDTLTVKAGNSGQVVTFTVGGSNATNGTKNVNGGGITLKDLQTFLEVQDLDNSGAADFDVTITGGKVKVDNLDSLSVAFGGSLATSLGISGTAAAAGGYVQSAAAVYAGQQHSPDIATSSTLMRNVTSANGTLISSGQGQPGDDLTVQTANGLVKIVMTADTTVGDVLNQINAIDSNLKVSLDTNGRFVVDNQTTGSVTFGGAAAALFNDPSGNSTDYVFATNTAGNAQTSARVMYAGFKADPSSTSGSTAIDSTKSAQFDTLRTQLDELVADASYQGTNLISSSSNSPLTVTFNEKATGASKLVINAVDLTTSGLTIKKASGTDAGSWSNADAVRNTLTNLTQAATTLRNQAATLGYNLSTVQNRQDFANNMISTLKEGADKLTLADMNEEGANMLALQTRSQLGTQSLSLASQANQAVMRLFG